MLVIIRGAGDIATGIALRLKRSHISVIMTDIPAPTAIRRTVAFSQCMYDGTAAVEGLTARRASGKAEALAALARRRAQKGAPAPQQQKRGEHTPEDPVKCPGCGARLRVPRGKGKIMITCPNCKKEFVKKT